MIESRIDLSHINSLIDYLTLGLRLVPLQPLSKIPFRANEPDHITGWSVTFLDTTDELKDFKRMHQQFNLALYWLGCQVDMDSNEAIEWGRQHGVNSLEQVWILKTARGCRVFYTSPKDCPPTYIDSTHKRPDLIAPGRLAVVPPSIHPSGFKYMWVKGHSPMDYPPNELTTPPTSIMKSWMSLKQPSIKRINRNENAPVWISLVFEAIYDYLVGKGHILRQRLDGGFITTCPLHDDHNPSLSIHPQYGWKCFSGCGEGRLTLLAALLGIEIEHWRSR